MKRKYLHIIIVYILSKESYFIRKLYFTTPIICIQSVGTV